MNLTLTAEQAAQFPTGYIVVEGAPSDAFPTDGLVPPAEWVKATEPCETCGGEPCDRCGGSGKQTEQHDYATEVVGCGWCLGAPCPDCRDGKPVVEFRTTDWCEVVTCGAERHRHPSTANTSCNLGTVLVGHGTIDALLPVVDDGYIVPGQDYVEAVDGGEVVLWRLIDQIDPEAHTSTFLWDAPDNQPTPGRDFVAVLANVEQP